MITWSLLLTVALHPLLLAAHSTSYEEHMKQEGWTSCGTQDDIWYDGQHVGEAEGVLFWSVQRVGWSRQRFRWFGPLVVLKDWPREVWPWVGMTLPNGMSIQQLQSYGVQPGVEHLRRFGGCAA